MREFPLLRRGWLCVLAVCWLVGAGVDCLRAEEPSRLPRTAAWEHPEATVETLADLMVAGIDRFLLKETERASEERKKFWSRDLSSAPAYLNSVASQRERLQWIIGLRDERIPFVSPTLVGTLQESALVGTLVKRSAADAQDEQRIDAPRVLRISWPVTEGLVWEGLLVEPAAPATANFILLPDAGMSPEQVLESITAEDHGLQQLVQAGCRLMIPTLISRTVHPRRRVELTDREFVYRTSFEMGRHPLGYETQAVLGLVDWLKREDSTPAPALFVAGIGEGGLVALLSTAVDPRIDGACVSGYFGNRQQLWQEPLDRNLFGYLEQFGDAELATLVAPRPLVVETTWLPQQTIATKGGGPGRLHPSETPDVEQEWKRFQELLASGKMTENCRLITFPEDAAQQWLSVAAVRHLLQTGAGLSLSEQQERFVMRSAVSADRLAEFEAGRQARLVEQITAHNQQLLEQSSDIRKAFIADLDTSSLENFTRTIEPYRRHFRDEVIGRFEQPLLAPRPRSRMWRETEHWTGYEVQLDVFPDVFAYGILLLPKNIAAGEQRPVVVFQHGLEGTPLGTIEGDHRAYHDFGAKLAEEGFIVFAPQNPYRGQDAFRTLQRKANPLGKTLFSIIVPQHEQITRWLAEMPEVAADKIAFYGLSYGGKTAMRVPPLVPNYCLSICSADFNDWIRKNMSTSSNYSYVWTGEYEIYEFDLGNTFSYAEMAALIAPRPFMVERGHFDGVAPDEWVASEFAKVHRLYQVQLGLTEASRIEWFKGPHAIHGQGTLEFLNLHLRDQSADASSK